MNDVKLVEEVNSENLSEEALADLARRLAEFSGADYNPGRTEGETSAYEAYGSEAGDTCDTDAGSDSDSDDDDSDGD